jgi:dihydroorotase
LAEKEKPYPTSPSGMPGVQTMLSVLTTFVSQGRLSFEQLVSMACTRPAEMYGIAGKGRIEAGFDADIVLLDPTRSRVVEKQMLQSKCGWSPYEGESLIGWPEAVVLDGTIVVRSDERIGVPCGRMLQFE